MERAEKRGTEFSQTHCWSLSLSLSLFILFLKTVRQAQRKHIHAAHQIIHGNTETAVEQLFSPGFQQATSVDIPQIGLLSVTPTGQDVAKQQEIKPPDSQSQEDKMYEVSPSIESARPPEQ